MSCDCGKPKCNGHCGVSPAVLQINNPSECVLFHRVEVPASMGDSKTNPPKSGAYKNVLLYYEADQTSWLYSSDGIPQKLVNGLTNYEDAINLPQINGETLIGDKSSADLKLADAPMVITIDLGNQNDWSVVYNSLGPMLALGAGGVSSSQYDNRVRVVSLTPPTSTTFHNENTDTDMTLEEVFDLIESGEDVVFNNVPVGTYYDARSQVYYPLGYAVNGVRVSDKLNYSNGAAFTGHVAIEVPSPQSLDTQWDYSYPIVASISIRKLVVINGDISTTSYYLDVDGIYDGIAAD